MGMGFEIQEDDVRNVLRQHEIRLSEEAVEELFEMLDEDAIESAALECDDMDEQTQSAYDEIWRQVQNAPHLEAWRAAQRKENLAGAVPSSTPPRSPSRM